MKNASLITTIIAPWLVPQVGILLAIKDLKMRFQEMKSKMRMDFRTGPGSSYKPSGSSSSKDNASTDSSVVSVDGNLAAEARRLFDSGDVSGALQKILNAPGQMGRMEALLGFVKTLDAEGVEAALPFVRGMGRGGDQFMSMGLLMGRYAEIDPERALTYVGKQGGMEEDSVHLRFANLGC